MPTVSLPIGGRTYDLTCRAGGEDALRRLAGRVDEKVRQAAASAGQTDEVRRLLFAALLLADETAAAPPQPQSLDLDAVADAVERLAARVEKLAARLEEELPAA
ncbi:cell division protein ZapA [Sphingomonas jejuensis]|uniref:Cell division protein ZapA n=1 Tax=Sphingomonas jejuensis TaxID=904715 RepID=A0ABX0XJZ2_9SPHN|nr:cell division protein ZapA [Sphingomonas jejuensis]NJC33159.1 cell division protein ZapA [Sphingomonas jejuensis]